jgi:hypothetical protein
VSDPEDRYLATSVIYQVNDPVTPLSYPIAIRVSGEFFGTVRPRADSECPKSLNDPLTISLGAYCLKFLCG